MKNHTFQASRLRGCEDVCIYCVHFANDPIHALTGDMPTTGQKHVLRAHNHVKPSNPKDAIGIGKPPLSTVPATVTHEVGLAMLEGACKYGRHNYRVIGVRASVYYDAAQRHMNKWWEGQDTDPDSGLPHITKAIACLYVLRDAMIRDMLTDDRPPMAPAGFFADLEAKTKEILSRFPDPVPAYTQLGESEKEQDATLKMP